MELQYQMLTMIGRPSTQRSSQQGNWLQLELPIRPMISPTRGNYNHRDSRESTISQVRSQEQKCAQGQSSSCTPTLAQHMSSQHGSLPMLLRQYKHTFLLLLIHRQSSRLVRSSLEPSRSKPPRRVLLFLCSSLMGTYSLGTISYGRQIFLLQISSNWLFSRNFRATALTHGSRITGIRQNSSLTPRNTTPP